jgi:hypothetical protein
MRGQEVNPMAAQKPLHRKAGVGASHELRTAEEYLDQALASEDGEISPDEIDSLRESVQAIRDGRMTLEEFERKHGY